MSPRSSTLCIPTIYLRSVVLPSQVEHHTALSAKSISKVILSENARFTDLPDLPDLSFSFPFF